jgi:hypothetical protein
VKKRKIVFTVLLALGVVFSLLAEHFSDFVETYYSAGFYYGVIRPYGILIGYLPFSLAEVTVVLSAFYGAYLHKRDDTVHTKPDGIFKAFAEKNAPYVVSFPCSFFDVSIDVGLTLQPKNLFGNCRLYLGGFLRNGVSGTGKAFGCFSQ